MAGLKDVITQGNDDQLLYKEHLKRYIGDIPITNACCMSEEAMLRTEASAEPGRILSCILYILMMIVVLPMMPMINRASFYYTERGIPVDFGIARGIGSMAFSAMSFAAGRFTVLWGSRMVPVLACVSALLFLATTTAGVNVMIIAFTAAAALGTLITIIDIRKK